MITFHFKIIQDCGDTMENLNEMGTQKLFKRSFEIFCFVLNFNLIVK